MPAIALDMIEPLSGVLTESVAAVVAREASALNDLLAAHQNRCVIYGAGTLGRKAIALLREIGVTPLAVVDSNPQRWGSEISGLPVLSPADAAKQFGSNAIFFVTIWNDFHWFSDTRTKLTALGCTSVSSYAPIFWKFGPRFMDLLLLNEPPHRLYRDRDRVLEAESLGADEESLATYRANILWRALGDPSHLPCPAPQNTYFPADIFRIAPEEVLVDCGAFDGDTIRMTRSVAGSNFKAIHAIEADAVSLKKMRDYLATLDSSTQAKIHIHECAVGAERCTLQFMMTGALTSKSGGDEAAAEAVDVPCIPLDELFVAGPVTFIKMDIEGAEFDALRGGAAIIRRDNPILAICVYHTQNDIWRIPLLLRSLNPAYSFFLRTYDGDGFQSVVYAIPPHRMLSNSERAAAPKPRKQPAPNPTSNSALVSSPPPVSTLPPGAA
jgi:FkbM family methyltransferase